MADTVTYIVHATGYTPPTPTSARADGGAVQTVSMGAGSPVEQTAIFHDASDPVPAGDSNEFRRWQTSLPSGEGNRRIITDRIAKRIAQYDQFLATYATASNTEKNVMIRDTFVPQVVLDLKRIARLLAGLLDDAE